MSAETSRQQWWLPVAGMVFLAFGIGIGGGSLLGLGFGGVFGTPEETTPLGTPSNVEQRADLIAGEDPEPQTPDQVESAAPPNQDSLTLTPPAQATAPPPTEDARSLERHLLAIDSPLTPAATEIAERIRQNRKDRQAAQTLARSSDETATTPAAAGTGLSRPAAALQSGLVPATQPLHVLARGAVIPAVLQSPIDSELPGLVRAQVSDDVYDSLTGRHILIPRGAKLIGTYGQAGGSGQRRLFVAWTDLRMPDGTPIDLDQFTTLGSDGASGLKGQRRTSFWKALGAAMLFDLAGNTTAILTNQPAQPESDIGALAGAALGNASSRVTSDYIGSLLAQGTKFKVKAGSLMNVLVEQDLPLPAIPQREVLR